MHEKKISAKEAVLRYKAEMEEQFKFDYLALIKDKNDIEIDKMYKMMLTEKLLHYRHYRAFTIIEFKLLNKNKETLLYCFLLVLLPQKYK
jgi:hypothetical protein